MLLITVTHRWLAYLTWRGLAVSAALAAGKYNSGVAHVPSGGAAAAVPERILVAGDWPAQIHQFGRGGRQPTMRSAQIAPSGASQAATSATALANHNGGYLRGGCRPAPPIDKRDSGSGPARLPAGHERLVVMPAARPWTAEVPVMGARGAASPQPWHAYVWELYGWE